MNQSVIREMGPWTHQCKLVLWFGNHLKGIVLSPALDEELLRNIGVIVKHAGQAIQLHHIHLVVFGQVGE
jgi:hypothetical protein